MSLHLSSTCAAASSTNTNANTNEDVDMLLNVSTPPSSPINIENKVNSFKWTPEKDTELHELVLKYHDGKIGTWREVAELLNYPNSSTKFKDVSRRWYRRKNNKVNHPQLITTDIKSKHPLRDGVNIKAIRIRGVVSTINKIIAPLVCPVIIHIMRVIDTENNTCIVCVPASDINNLCKFSTWDYTGFCSTWESPKDKVAIPNNNLICITVSGIERLIKMGVPHSDFIEKQLLPCLLFAMTVKITPSDEEKEKAEKEEKEEKSVRKRLFEEKPAITNISNSSQTVDGLEKSINRIDTLEHPTKKRRVLPSGFLTADQLRDKLYFDQLIEKTIIAQNKLTCTVREFQISVEGVSDSILEEFKNTMRDNNYTIGPVTNNMISISI